MNQIGLGYLGRAVVGGCLALLSSCGGSDPDGTVDPAALAAAPQATKDICEKVCAAADLVRSKGCGMVEFSTHAECYKQCVSRYLLHEPCKDLFDDSNECVIDAGCNYQIQCLGKIIPASACLQGD